MAPAPGTNRPSLVRHLKVLIPSSTVLSMSSIMLSVDPRTYSSGQRPLRTNIHTAVVLGESRVSVHVDQMRQNEVRWCSTAKGTANKSTTPRTALSFQGKERAAPGGIRTHDTLLSRRVLYQPRNIFWYKSRPLHTTCCRCPSLMSSVI